MPFINTIEKDKVINLFLYYFGGFYMFLLIIIYIAFIGLGIPDSLIGAAWPAIYTDWAISESSVSIITLTISGCTVLSSVLSTGILNKFGAHKVSAVSTAMTAIALIGFSLSPNLLVMWLCAIMLGLGAGAIDAGLNNYIALQYTANHMNLLHGFYGIGVSASPYIMSLAISGGAWRKGYLYAFILQSIITVILFASFPLWKKSDSSSAEEKPKKLSMLEMFRMSKLRTVWVIMLATNIIEYVCGIWGSYYLIKTKGLSVAEGAVALTLYYAGLASGRFLSGILAQKIYTWKRIYIGLTRLLGAIIMLLIPNVAVLSIAGLFAVGFGNGSIYPNFLHLTPYNFGKDISQAVMGSQIALAYIGVMIAPPMFGLINSLFGSQSFPIFVSLFYIVMVIAILYLVKQIKFEGKYNKEI